MPETKHCLILTQPDGSVKHYLFAAERVTVGRSDGNAIVLDWETVSGTHCEFRKTEKGIEIVDLGSTNGTQFNGKEMGDEPRLVSEGDSVVIGLKVKARVVVLEELVKPAEMKTGSGATTQKLRDPKPTPAPSINPVAAAVAKASKGLRGA